MEYGRADSGTARKFGAQRAQRVDIVGTGQHDVLRLLIQPREVAQQVTDVRADTEVVELARVDRDSHQGER